MSNRIIIKPIVEDRFNDFMEHGRVLFFSAPCGFGKSTLAKALLGKRNAFCLSAYSSDFSIPKDSNDFDILMLDDLQYMQDNDDWQALCELIRSSPSKKFLLLSRGTPQGNLMAFQYTGLMTVLDADSLLFNSSDIQRLFSSYGLKFSLSDIDILLNKVVGYPLGMVMTANLLASGKKFNDELVAMLYREMFLYFETNIYQRFDLPIRRFLLELAPFERFDFEMARMVSGNSRAGDLLEWLQRNTTMLRYDGIGGFHFWSEFRDFLLWETEREYSDKKRKALFNRGGLYYELKEDYPHALECYEKGGDYSKISELLIRNAELHPSLGHYSEMEKYYRALPKSEILVSPSLMQGMSMLCALTSDYEGSEYWYHELELFYQRCLEQDAAGTQARSRLAWLDISLPQRSVETLTEAIPVLFQDISDKKLALPPVSVTSNLPSILNGGKDFSQYALCEDELYEKLSSAIEQIFGRDGIGLADCILAEIKFEKGEDISARILALLPRMEEIQRKGTPDIKFAVTGLLARNQLSTGSSDEARHTVLTHRTYCENEGLTRFLPNIDALLCRISLHTGDLEAVNQWYQTSAPRDRLHFDVMKRYQYLTQAMAELALGLPDSALMTLSPLKPYFKTCRRHIDMIHLHLLNAIALYRKKDTAWKQHLTDALKAAEDFGYIRPVSIYGAAVLPLLDGFIWDGNIAWYKKLLIDTRMCAAFYPNFLQPRLSPENELTDTEKQVLRLMCADKSNAEIGAVLNIKLTTVKTHVSHILEKLDVSRRSEAKTEAKRLRLIPTDF